ncbi:cytochrome c5 family protein [Solimonas sp. K1W22B-7]|nr:cytochrome c5 family protein [Solimonas sp. K1W22B-7]
MDHKNHDSVFFANFGKVMGALFLIFFICIGAAALIDKGDGHGDATGKDRLNARTAPLGTVVTDPNVLLQMQAASKVQRAAYTGDQVVAKVCGACHDAGVLGAPHDKASWSARKGASGGLDGLVKHAVDGKNNMPPRGGDPDLSDEEIKAAVEVLLKKHGV